MEEKVTALAAEYDMLPPGGTVLCAVSGGADSMCLLSLLADLAPRRGFTLAAGHFDHRLRPSSGREADFVRAWCEGRGIPFYLGGGDVAARAKETGAGIEETARAMRYAFLQAQAQALGGAHIATAHTADDNGETLLLHLVRGSGLQGLTGIAPRRGNIVRPLLTVTRGEIMDYLDVHGVPHVEDESNGDTRYARNFIRREVMPLLKTLNPNLTRRLNETAFALRGDNDCLNARAAAVYAGMERAAGMAALPCALLTGQPPAMAARGVQRMAAAVDPDLVLSAAQRRAVLALAAGADPSGEVSLPRGVKAMRLYDRLALIVGEGPPPLAPQVLPLPGQAEAGLFSVLARRVKYAGESNLPYSFYLACDKIGTSLTLRARRTGDRLRLPGRGGSRTVKQLMIDRRVPRVLRDRTPVLDAGGAVAAVAGLGPEERFLPQPGQAAWQIEIRKGDFGS